MHSLPNQTKGAKASLHQALELGRRYVFLWRRFKTTFIPMRRYCSAAQQFVNVALIIKVGWAMPVSVQGIPQW